MKPPASSRTNAAPAPRNIQARLLRRMGLIILLFIVLILGLTYYFINTGLSDQIRFAQQEKRGNAYLANLEDLLQNLQDEKILYARSVRGDTTSRASLDTLKAKTEQSFETLEASNKQLGAALSIDQDDLKKAQFSPDLIPTTLHQQWTDLRNHLDDDPNQAKLRYADLVSKVISLMNYVRDTSNLILDTDLDSFYLIDALDNILLQNQERLGNLQSYVEEANSQPINPDIARELSNRLALLQSSDYTKIAARSERALNEDKNFPTLRPREIASFQTEFGGDSGALKKYLATESPIADLMNKLIAGDTSVSIDLVSTLAQTRKQSFAFWTVGGTQLDLLLDDRIDALRTAIISGVAVGVVGLFAATGFAFYIAQLFVKDFTKLLVSEASAQTELEEKKRLQAQILELLDTVSEASEGNLSVRANVGEGALGNVADGLNLMIENVGELISSAQAASDRVSVAAKDITEVTLQLLQAAELQREEMNQATEGVKLLNKQAETVLQSCQNATGAVETAQNAAAQGAQAILEVVAGMEKIRDNVQLNAKKIKRLGDRTLEISGIVKAISEISGKTDMLALNASMEAARAGEQGKGFTVIAEQVRALAERTRNLTVEIEKQVSGIQTETQEAVLQMETQTQFVESGVTQVSLAGETLENIVQSSTQSEELVGDINQAATRQAERTQLMLKNVEKMGQLAAAARQSVMKASSTSDQLAKLSDKLNGELSRFRTTALN